MRISPKLQEALQPVHAHELAECASVRGTAPLQMKRSWSLRLQKDERVHLLVDFELQSRIPWFAESIVRGEIAKQTSETFDAATKE